MADAQKKALIPVTLMVIPHAGFNGYRIQAQLGTKGIYVERGKRIKVPCDEASLITLLQDQKVIILDPPSETLRQQLAVKLPPSVLSQPAVEFEVLEEKAAAPSTPLATPRK